MPMTDFARLRQGMVDGQIRANDVTDPRIIAAMAELPRERFVPEPIRDLAYIDADLPIRRGGNDPARYLMEPRVLAKLVQALRVGVGDKVLDVGTGTGYSAALLVRLAAMVVALEEDGELAARAQALLTELAGGASRVVTGPLAAGWSAEAPYDVILINGAVETVPQGLLSQLKEGGRLGAVIRSGAASRVTIRTRIGDMFPARGVFDAAVPLLPGFEAPREFVF